MSKQVEVSAGRASVTGLELLAVAFVVLKLTGVVGWSWVWVLAPVWIPLGLMVSLFGVAGILYLVARVAK